VITLFALRFLSNSMIEIIVKKTESSNFEWINLIDPTLRELSQISVQYDLHSTSVHDCLEPEHLPKFEQNDDVAFLITRGYDADADPTGDTIRKLTNKLAVFVHRDYVITVHRTDRDYLKVIRNKWKVANRVSDMANAILIDLLKGIISTYENPILNAMEEIEEYEKEIFAGTTPASIIQKMYLLRRRTAVYKKMLYMFHENLIKRGLLQQETAPYLQDMVDTSEQLYYNAEQLLENATNLLNIHLSLASHRTNEVMRVLTIFSVFFLPLSFVVGLYGMNFDFIPELKWKFGYHYVWVSMISIAVGIYFWFRSRGWLND
jgi:magnesium transporter